MAHQEAQWESAPLAGHTSAAGTSPRHPSGEARGRPWLEQAGGRFRAMGGRVRRCEPGRFLSDRAAALGLGDGRSVRLCEAGAAVASAQPLLLDGKVVVGGGGELDRRIGQR